MEVRWSPRARAVVMVIGGSLISTLPFTATTPLLPPVAFLAFALWCQLRPDLLPPWSALGFALFDDLVSGNPLGTALFLWPLFGLALRTSDRWFLFRSWRQDWFVTAIAGLGYLTALWWLAPLHGGAPPIGSLLLPAAASVILIPFLLRLATGPGFSARRRR